MKRGLSASSPKASRTRAMALLRPRSKSTVVSAGQRRFCSSSRVSNFARPFDERHQRLKRLVLQFDSYALLAQFSGSQIYLEYPEPDWRWRRQTAVSPSIQTVSPS